MLSSHDATHDRCHPPLISRPRVLSGVCLAGSAAILALGNVVAFAQEPREAGLEVFGRFDASVLGAAP